MTRTTLPGASLLRAPLGISIASTSRFRAMFSFAAINSKQNSALLGRDRLFFVRQCGLQRVPRQSRALHAHRIFTDSTKHGQLTEIALRSIALRFSGDQLVKLLEQ